MKHLGKEDQALILDFYFRCGEEHDIERGCDLIASNPEAAKLYAGLEQTLTGLDNLKYEPCPDNLVDLTISRLKTVATNPNPPVSRLKELLDDQQSAVLTVPQAAKDESEIKKPKQSNPFFIRPVFELLATAATIVLVAGVFFPGAGALRARSQRIACDYNMGRIGSAFASFYEDHQGSVSDSEVRVKAGSPWWKIGDQGAETQSNTRLPFMLLKGDYVDGNVFVCKGDKQAQLCTPEDVKNKIDFPSRHHVSYSFMLFCDKSKKNFVERRSRIVASDLNPVFVPVFQNISVEKSFYAKMNEFEKILLNDQLRQMMSRNHRGRGQNVLYCDGSVIYVKTRIIKGDDMFTVNGISEYTGCEIPSSENDIFLAP